jgi:hydrocephalus-inducing protein
MEFESIGCKIKNTKRFYIMNPTNQSYNFQWRIEEEKSDSNSGAGFFKCITQRGTILSGKKFEIIFEYTPET